MLTIEKYNPSYKEKIRFYLYNNQQATPFHSVEWYNIIYENYGHQNETLIALENNKVCGILPMSLISIYPSNNYLATGPFSSHCEVLGDRDDIKNALISAATITSQNYKAKYVEFKNVKKIEITKTDYRTFNHLHNNNYYCTMIIECNDEKETWDKLSTKSRTEIRNSYKKNLKVFSSPDKFDEFYYLTSLTMKRHGTPVHSYNFYKDLLFKMENAFLISVLLEDKVIASNLLLGSNNTLHSLASASDYKYWSYKPNQLAWWECIKFAIKNNYKYLDFGRSIKDEGTYHFKRKFGAKAIELNYLYYLNEATEIPQLNKENYILNFATSIWKKLPLKLTQKTGHYFIRNIS